MTDRDDLLTDEGIWDAYNELLLSPDISRIRKMLARYELLKRALAVPGDIAECGVFKGAGLLYWLKLLTILDPGGMRRVVGFDTFTGFASVEVDQSRENPAGYAELEFENFTGVAAETIESYARAASVDARLQLVQGDVSETAPTWVEESPGARIALLHLDLDTYVGTKAALVALYPRVTRGGIIVMDEYGFAQFGESAAVDEFLEERPELSIHAVPESHSPTAYIVKP